MSLVVTPGETTLIDELTRRDTLFIVENLLIGDVHLRNAAGETVYIFERKAKTDLDASIKDGRYHEQKDRLIKCGLERHQVVYIIEALTRPTEDSYKRVWSSMSHSYHRDGFGVFQTRNTAETVDYLVAMVEAVTNHPRYSSSNAVESRDIDLNIKKTSVTPAEWLIYSLTLIPGVSKSIATAVTATFPKITNLAQATAKEIAELKHGGQQRRVGPKLAEKIKRYVENV